VFSLEAQPTGDEASIQGTTSDPKQLAWERRIVSSGQLNGTDFTLLVSMTDGYSEAARSSTRRQLAAALSNPNLAEFVRSQLQLGENALQVLDADQDGELNDDEFAIAWGWMSGARGTRGLARWSLAELSWFQLADRDGDGRVTELELGGLVHRIVALDKDADGLVSPNEAPLAMRLEISRADSRLAALSGALPPNDQPTRSTADWFAAMDANDDGFISKLEFLGSKEDFGTYDADSDGYISRPEGFPH
jgi:Ca2+-binding EF-hand superfamily protein